MTTRAELETFLLEYGDTPRESLPRRLLQPTSTHDFNLSFIHAARAFGYGHVEPVYDDADELVGWRGISLK